MKIAMTGASGFVGRAITMRLVDRGETVIPARRASHRDADLSWDVEGGFDPASALAGFDAVIHLAGASVAVRWTDEHKAAIRQSRVAGTKSVVKALRDAGKERPKTLVCASAIGYYGTSTAARDESSPAGDDFLAEVVEAWEAEARKACDIEGVRVVMLRLGVVFGAGGGALPKMLPAFRLGLGGRLGDGEQVMSWVHIDDVVSGFEQALDSPTMEGAYNLTAPNPVTNAEFTEAMGRALGRPTFMRVPSFILKTVLGEMGETVLLSGQRVVPKRLTETGFSFRFDQVALALKDILAGDD